MGIILLSALVLLWLCLLPCSERPLDAWLKGITVWCSLLFVQTEVLSLFEGITFASSLLFWSIVCIGAVCGLYFVYGGLKNAVRSISAKAGHIIQYNKLLAVLLFLIGGFSVITVPYNWDSMTYHLPRIVHWAQNQSVAHYGTNIIRQISSPPLHEFIGLQIYLLSGEKDLFLNGIQFIAFFTNAAMIYGISQKAGCKGRFCKIGALLFCSMPIAFGEALTTQNDHLAGMWLLLFMYYFLDFLPGDQKLRYDGATAGKCVMLAASVGYGYLTKPSACIGMLFLALVLLIVCIRRRDSILVIGKLIGTVVPVMAVILAPEMIRNLVTFQAMLHSGTGARQLVGTLDPRYLLINCLKNLVCHLPTVLIPQSSRRIASFIGRIAFLIGVDINDPGISEDGRYFVLGAPGDYGHDTAVNSLIMMMAGLSFLWCLYRWIKAGRKAGKKTGRCRTDEILLFRRKYACMVTVLLLIISVTVRWEPFVSRYMLPYLALLCPMVSMQLEDFSEMSGGKVRRVVCVWAAGGLCIMQLGALFSYHMHIIKRQGGERPEGYFYNRSNIADVYLVSCRFIRDRGYGKVGLILGEDSYEYPLWSMLQGYAERIEHVQIGNESGIYEDPEYIPDCVFVSGVPESGQEMIEVHGISYRRELSSEEAAVYVKNVFPDNPPGVGHTGSGAINRRNGGKRNATSNQSEPGLEILQEGCGAARGTACSLDRGELAPHLECGGRT